MEITTLDECKAHARIELDEEDAILETYAEGAEEMAQHIMGRDFSSLYAEYGKMPNMVKQAVWMLFAVFATNRTPATMQNYYLVPYGNIDALLQPYMIL